MLEQGLRMVAVGSYLGAAVFWLVGTLTGEVLRTPIAQIEAPAVAILALVILLNLAAAATGWRAPAGRAHWAGGAAAILNTVFLYPQAPVLDLRIGASLILIVLVAGQASWWIFYGRGTGRSAPEAEQSGPSDERVARGGSGSLLTWLRPLWLAAFAAAALFWPIVAARPDLFAVRAPQISAFGLGFVALAIILNVASTVIVTMNPSPARQARGVLAIFCNVVPFSSESPLGTLLIGPTIALVALLGLQIVWAFLYGQAVSGRGRS